MAPAEEYARRLRDREASAARYEGVHVRLGYLRLLLLAALLLLAWQSLGRGKLSAWWLAVPAALFLASGAYHSRVLRRKEMAERTADFYRKGLERLEDRWRGRGEHGERFQNPHHVYSGDLDLFGTGSLFEMLSTARTRMGEETLARWLLAPAGAAEVVKRQQALAELRERLDVREELFALGKAEGAGVHPRPLLRWAEAPSLLQSPWLRWLAAALAVLFVASLALWIKLDVATPAVLVLLAETALLYRYRSKLTQVLHETELAFEDLGLLSSMLARLERERFTSARLVELTAQLASHHVGGSQAIRRLATVVDFIDSCDNLLLRVLNVPLLYTLQVAFAAEAWRREHGGAVRFWLNAIGEMEALLALAGYSYEHPLDCFPEFMVNGASFIADELGHPLIPEAACVRNNVALHGETRALLVSGSNMSGKSTLLRAVGINTVLAMAGAPVRARCLRLSALQVGASIRINDSLQEGSSRFHAELARLRQIFELEKHGESQKPGMPVLFLLDELLQGTNSKDRRVGAEGVLRALVERGDIGLVSTHDLALTEIACALPGKLVNVHFQDEIAHGSMSFDYRLRLGVVEKGNGLALMRLMGLEV